MTREQPDYEDTLVWVLFGLAAGASVGIADVTLFNYAFTDVNIEVGSSNHGVTVTTLLTAGTFGWVCYTTEPDFDELNDRESPKRASENRLYRPPFLTASPSNEFP